MLLGWEDNLNLTLSVKKSSPDCEINTNKQSCFQETTSAELPGSRRARSPHVSSRPGSGGPLGRRRGRAAPSRIQRGCHRALGLCAPREPVCSARPRPSAGVGKGKTPGRARDPATPRRRGGGGLLCPEPRRGKPGPPRGWEPEGCISTCPRYFLGLWLEFASSPH